MRLSPCQSRDWAPCDLISLRKQSVIPLTFSPYTIHIVHLICFLSFQCGSVPQDLWPYDCQIINSTTITTTRDRHRDWEKGKRNWDKANANLVHAMPNSTRAPFIFKLLNLACIREISKGDPVGLTDLSKGFNEHQKLVPKQRTWPKRLRKTGNITLGWKVDLFVWEQQAEEGTYGKRCMEGNETELKINCKAHPYGWNFMPHEHFRIGIRAIRVPRICQCVWPFSSPIRSPNY